MKRNFSVWSKLRLVFALAALLLFNSAQFAQANEDATRRLMVAVNGYQLNEDAAKDALEQGADINWKNDAMNGETMLIMAIKSFQDAKVVKFLLANGANASIKDDSGRTALSWARQYNFSRNHNGRQIIQMLEQATGQTKKAAPVTAKKPLAKKTAKSSTPKRVAAKTTPNRTAAVKSRRNSGPPSAAEVRQTLERSFTSAYQNHYFGVKNKVSFKWSGGITVGSPIQALRPLRKCYPVKLQVEVIITDPRDGNMGSVRRGMNAEIGGYRKTEIFCLFRNGFGEWDYGTYEP